MRPFINPNWISLLGTRREETGTTVLKRQILQLAPVPSDSTMPHHCHRFPRLQALSLPSSLPNTCPAIPSHTTILGTHQEGGCWLSPLVHPLELQGVAGNEVSHRRARAQPAVQLEDVPEAGSLVSYGNRSPLSCPLSLPPQAAQHRVTIPCLVT